MDDAKWGKEKRETERRERERGGRERKQRNIERERERGEGRKEKDRRMRKDDFSSLSFYSLLSSSPVPIAMLKDATKLKLKDQLAALSKAVFDGKFGSSETNAHR